MDFIVFKSQYSVHNVNHLNKSIKKYLQIDYLENRNVLFPEKEKL